MSWMNNYAGRRFIMGFFKSIFKPFKAIGHVFEKHVIRPIVHNPTAALMGGVIGANVEEHMRNQGKIAQTSNKTQSNKQSIPLGSASAPYMPSQPSSYTPAPISRPSRSAQHNQTSNRTNRPHRTNASIATRNYRGERSLGGLFGYDDASRPTFNGTMGRYDRTATTISRGRTTVARISPMVVPSISHPINQDEMERELQGRLGR